MKLPDQVRLTPKSAESSAFKHVKVNTGDRYRKINNITLVIKKSFKIFLSAARANTRCVDLEGACACVCARVCVYVCVCELFQRVGFWKVGGGGSKIGNGHAKFHFV